MSNPRYACKLWLDADIYEVILKYAKIRCISFHAALSDVVIYGCSQMFKPYPIASIEERLIGTAESK